MTMHGLIFVIPRDLATAWPEVLASKSLRATDLETTTERDPFGHPFQSVNGRVNLDGITIFVTPSPGARAETASPIAGEIVLLLSWSRDQHASTTMNDLVLSVVREPLEKVGAKYIPPPSSS